MTDRPVETVRDYGMAINVDKLSVMRTTGGNYRGKPGTRRYGQIT